MINKQTKIVGIFLFALYAAMIVACSDGGSGSEGARTVGVAGSTARFAIINNYLYTISGQKLQLFDLQDPSKPNPWAIVNVNFGIETLFSRQSHLFIGARDGMYIYDNNNPENPSFLSFYAHRISCDPVVVQGDYAYVTLKGSGRCGAAGNQLDVINIADITNPRLEKTYPMQEPTGLGIDGNKLFICDGVAGLKVFNASDPLKLSVLDIIPDLNCNDVIPNNNVLVVSDSLGLLQYDYTSDQIQLLSEITITQ